MAFKIADGYVDIHGRVDRRDVRRAAHRAGQQAGDQFGRGFSERLRNFTRQWRREFLRAMPTNWLTFGPMAAVAFAGLAKLGARIAGLAGHMASALPSVAALIPVVLGLGSAFGLLAKAVSDEVFKDLAGFVKLGEAMSRANERWLRSLDELVEHMTPRLTRHFNAISRSMAGMFDRIHEALGGGLGGRFSGLLAAMEATFDDMARVFVNLIRIIVTLGNAAGEQGERFTEWLRRSTARFAAFLAEKDRAGDLAAFFRRTGDAMALWGEIAGNILGAIAGMLAGLAKPGKRFAERLRDITQAWQNWSWDEDTHGKIRDFIVTLGNIPVGRIAKVAASILAIGVAFKTLAGLTNITSGIAGLVTLFRTFPGAGVFTGVITGLGLVAGALTFAFMESRRFRRSMRNLWNFLADTLGPFLQGFAAGFRDGFVQQARIAARVVNTRLVPALENLFDRLGLSRDAFDQNHRSGRRFGRTTGWLAGTILVDLMNALSDVIEIFNQLIDVERATERAFDRLQDTADRVMAAIIVAVLEAARRFAAAFLSNFEKVLRALAAFIRPFNRNLATAATNAANDIRDMRVSMNRNINRIKRRIILRIRTRGFVRVMNRLDRLAKRSRQPLIFNASIRARERAVGDGPGAVSGGSAIARMRALARGLPVVLTSGYRSPAHNATISGASPTSYHMDRSNPAGDWGGPTWALDELYRRAVRAGGWRELLWRVPNHFDHVHAARTGGIRGGWTMVGEEGRELVKLPGGSKVHPHGQSERMVADGDEHRVVLELRAGGGRFDRMLVDLLRDAIKVRGGNVQVVLGAG